MLVLQAGRCAVCADVVDGDRAREEGGESDGDAEELAAALERAPVEVYCFWIHGQLEYSTSTCVLWMVLVVLDRK